MTKTNVCGEFSFVLNYLKILKWNMKKSSFGKYFS